MRFELKSLAVLLFACLMSLAEARICTQNDVNNWNNCQGICCAVLFPPMFFACIACQDQAHSMGYRECYHVGQNNRYRKRGLGLDSCPSKNEVFDKFAQGESSFNRSTYLHKAKSDVFFDRKTHLKAFDRMDINGDGQVTFDEMYKGADL